MFDHYATLCMKGLNLEDPQSAQNEYLRSRMVRFVIPSA